MLASRNWPCRSPNNWGPNCSHRLCNARPSNHPPPIFCLAPAARALWMSAKANLAASVLVPAPPTGKNPPDIAPAVGGLFSPQSKSLGIDLTEHSPAIQHKIVYAGTAVSSFAKGAELLENLAEIPVNAKKVERLCQDIGNERVAQRDEADASFVALPLTQKFQAPAGVERPQLACVMPDGGRFQFRERCAEPVEPTGTGQPPGQAEQSEYDEEDPAAKGFWKEYKAGLLAWMQSEVHEQDPCADIPAGFLDVLRIPILAREIGKVAASPREETAEADEPRPLEQALEEESQYEPPRVKKRKVVATCRRWKDFAVSLASAAWLACFQLAARKVFVADGSANNWRVWARFFGSFTPVLDFVHVLSYVYAAATAGRGLAQGWECYQRWISWVWKGEVSKVIAQLQQRQGEVGVPAKGESETSVPSVVARTLGYLTNHQDKMKYPEYRQQGLPITSSLIESVMKQMNYRVKGTEKFWDKGAEAMVQLRADLISDDAPLDDFFEQRQANATGQRRYRRAA